MRIGVIGDDFTGSSDIGNTLAREGFATALFAGVPGGPAPDGIEAGVVALKIRAAPLEEAITQALTALDWLRAQGAECFVYKVCSTFDSTDAGNIGQVTAALADALGAEVVPVCPAFPGTGRTIYQGHLFVGDRLLSDTHMATHPLTPMTDPDLRRVLERQTGQPSGHLSLLTLRGTDARAALAGASRYVICDAVEDEDLRRLGAAAEGLPLITGASGVALGFRPMTAARADSWSAISGPVAALAGSVSAATQDQVEVHAAAGHPVLRLTPAEIMADRPVGEIADWVMASAGVPLVTTTAASDAVAEAQRTYGRDRLAARIEALYAALAIDLVARGVRRLITAGGETSGAVVEALAPGALTIGPEIDPGVPLLANATGDFGLALKSGNFGARDFFGKAARLMETDG